MYTLSNSVLKWIIPYTILIGLATGCTNSTPSTSTDKLAIIHSFRLTETHLIFSVSSNGCTDKNNFKLRFEPFPSARLSIIQLKYDGCRRRKKEVTLKYSLQTVNISVDQAFVLNNPVKPYQKTIFQDYHASRACNRIIIRSLYCLRPCSLLQWYYHNLHDQQHRAA